MSRRSSLPSRSRLGFISTLFILALYACSGGHGGQGGFATSSATIGPAGGQISSSDGKLTLTFPAGALATNTMISITPLATADLSATAQSIAPEEAYRIDPPGLSFAQPVDLELDFGSAESAEGSATAVIEPRRVVEDDGGNLSQVDQLRHVSSMSNGNLRALGQLVKTGAVITKLGYGTVELTPPASIPAGGSAPVSASITNGSSSSVLTLGSEEWSALSTGVTDDLSDSLVAFTGMFNVFCSGGATGGNVDVEIRYVATQSGGFGPGFSETVDVYIDFDVVCDMSPVTTVTAGVLSLAGILDSIESVQVVDRPGSNLQPPGQSAVFSAFLVAAGEVPGNGPGAAIIDPTRGTNPQQILIGGPGTAFDAHLIPSSGGTREALFTSGIDGFAIETLPGGNLASGGLISMGFHEDAAEVAGDAENGIVAAVGAAFRFVSVDDGNGIEFQSFLPSQPVRSVAANAARTRALAIRANSNDLAELVLDPSTSTVVSETPIRALGNSPRRIRWDPGSGLVGISDFSDSTITVLTWDGFSPPTFVGTANVGQGPVGIDVVDDQILCVGFGDDTWSRIGVDLLGLSIASVTTAPIPFTPVNGTSFSPGHIRALGDADKSVVISNFGDQSVTFLNNAYP